MSRENENKHRKGRELVGHPCFSWHGGMRMIDGDDGATCRLPEVFQGAWKRRPNVAPDIEDAATKGILIELLRFLLEKPGLHSSICPGEGLHTWHVWDGVESFSHGATEGEAIANGILSIPACFEPKTDFRDSEVCRD